MHLCGFVLVLAISRLWRHFSVLGQVVVWDDGGHLCLDRGEGVGGKSCLAGQDPEIFVLAVLGEGSTGVDTGLSRVVGQQHVVVHSGSGGAEEVNDALGFCGDWAVCISVD